MNSGSGERQRRQSGDRRAAARSADPVGAKGEPDPGFRPGILGELKRRNVLRMAGLYLVGAWLVVQVAATLLPLFDAPQWLARAVVWALVIGFAPAMVFSWVFELTPDGLKRETDVPLEASIGAHTGRRIEHATIVLLALALGLFAYDRFVLAPQRTQAAAAVAADEARVATLAGLEAAAAADVAIAVLPFDNLSADAEQVYFSDGLAEDLITMLAQFDGLRVIARTSSFQFRDGAATPQEIATALGVTRLVTGSVRRNADQVRVSLALVDTANGSTLWSQRYDRPVGDLFALQDEIIRAVAGELHAHLGGDPALLRNDRPKSGDVDAYNAYLRGVHLTNARGDRETMAAAVDALEDAVRLDPQYARAHAALAKTLLAAAGLFGDDALRPRSMARAREAATTAVALDPELPDVQLTLGYLATDADFDYAAADAAFERAVTLAPTNPAALVALSQSRATHGDLVAATGLVRRALEFDPLRRAAMTQGAYYLLRSGDLDGASALVRRYEALGPSLNSAILTAKIALQRRDVPAALAAADAIPDEEWAEIYRTQALQIGTDRAAADAALAALVEHQGDGSGFQIAEAYAIRGEADGVFEWLEKARASGDPGVSEVHVSFWLAAFADDPRFAAFCGELGLPTMARTDTAAPP
jgi:TolB-like protein/Tfp pilus assembly protein PilF